VKERREILEMERSKKKQWLIIKRKAILLHRAKLAEEHRIYSERQALVRSWLTQQKLAQVLTTALNVFRIKQGIRRF